MITKTTEKEAGQRRTEWDTRAKRIHRLRVVPHDSPLHYQVHSESMTEQPYMVDLGAYGGNGICSCKNFVCRLGPMLKQGRDPGSATRCKHILAARERLLRDVIRKLIETEREG